MGESTFQKAINQEFKKLPGNSTFLPLEFLGTDMPSPSRAFIKYFSKYTFFVLGGEKLAGARVSTSFRHRARRIGGLCGWITLAIILFFFENVSRGEVLNLAKGLN